MEQLEKAELQPREFKNKEKREQELITATKYTRETEVEASPAPCLATGAMMINIMMMMMIIIIMMMMRMMMKVPLLHGGLLPEPLLAGSAVLDVLHHIAQHGPLPALVLPHPLHPLVHFGTWSGDCGCDGEGVRDLQINRIRQ